jgi:tetratricopeptide (TPR) repeat protein
MRFQKVVLALGMTAWMGSSLAVPEVQGDAGRKPQVLSLDGLVENLGDEKFKVREEASLQLWHAGRAALPVLEAVATGPDPERAYRARDLIRKIELQIRPDTDPSVIALVERYHKATLDEKVELLGQMQKKRAWHQILKLYAADFTPELQTRLQISVGRIAITAARERLLQGDAAGAREFLEMAPADADGLLALADFHRSQGTWEAELNRAKELAGAAGLGWQLALYRVKGDLKSARELAREAGEVRLSNLFSALLGDPVPWMQSALAQMKEKEAPSLYTRLAIERWRGRTWQADELAPLVRIANSTSRSEREQGINALFLLGEVRAAENAYVKISPSAAFAYFESTERIPEALRALGLDPEKPDYPGWVRKRIVILSEEDVEEEEGVSMDASELILMANFLERRGEHVALDTAFSKPLLELAEKEPKAFTDFLGSLFGNAQLAESAPLLAKRLSIQWAGDDAERWQEVAMAAFGSQDEALAWWDWLAELDPTADRVERLDGMLALFRMMPDPQRLREKWLGRVWEALAKVPPENLKPFVARLVHLSGETRDVETNLRIWNFLPKEEQKEFYWRAYIGDLSAAERWDEAAAFFIQQIERTLRFKQDPQPWLYACSAACLRKAGREKEAVVYDDWVEKLSLGNDVIEIANGYAFGYDYQRAADWWSRAARQIEPETDESRVALNLHLEMLLEQGRWAEAGAVSEVLAMRVAARAADGESQLLMLKLRLQSDLGRALSLLKSDRKAAVAILEHSHRNSPGDGFMADYFFPAVRKVGLVAEHDQWFERSWKPLKEVIARYPDADNTCNTAAWLASRSLRNLDEAQKLLEKAIAMNPTQAAYLDTMAEIHFARGNRPKALEWSRRAINYRSDDAMLRRQYERFRHHPLPR